MARILALDLGEKRTGIAVSDPLKIIATGLTAIETKELIPFLKKYLNEEKVDTIVIGDPKRINENEPVQVLVNAKEAELKNLFPEIKIERHDERFTSMMAKTAINFSVKSKTERRSKALVDKVSAVIILQSFMEKK